MIAHDFNCDSFFRLAAKQLCADGEELHGKISLPQYLVYALTLFLGPLGTISCLYGIKVIKSQPIP